MEENRIRETFSKSEKLCSKKAIDCLFEKGSLFYVYPFKVIYNLDKHPEEPGQRVLISIPKKYLRRSVDRNHMKRLVRESYRRLKSRIHVPVKEAKTGLNIAIIFTGRKVISFQEVNQAIEQIISKIALVLDKESESQNFTAED
jgi:ribonuclease P protein component